MRRGAASSSRSDGNAIRASVSVGASEYPGDGEEADRLRKRADEAMYAAKAAGGNRLVFYRR